MLIYLFHVHDEYYQRRKIFPFFQFSSWVNHNPIYTSHELINIHQNNGNCKKENNKKRSSINNQVSDIYRSCELLLISQTKTRLSYNFEGETWENNCRKTLILCRFFYLQRFYLQNVTSMYKWQHEVWRKGFYPSLMMKHFTIWASSWATLLTWWKVLDSDGFHCSKELVGVFAP